MSDATVGNLLYYSLLDGDSYIVSNENGNLFIRVDWGDFYTTAAGTKGDWLLRKYGESIVVRDSDGVAYARDGDGDWFISSLPRVESVSSTDEVIPADTADADSEQAASEVADADEMTRRIWRAGYDRLIQDIADSGSPEEREQKIIAHMPELIAYWDSGIGTGNDLKYLRDNLSNPLLSRELIYRIAPNNPAFVDAELSDQDKELGYHLDYNPNGILWRVNAAGIPLLEDFYKFEEQQKVLQGSLRAPTAWESLQHLIPDTISCMERKDWEIATDELNRRGVTPENNPEYKAELEKEYQKQRQITNGFFGAFLTQGVGEVWSSGRVGLTMLKGSSKATEEIGGVAKQGSSFGKTPWGSWADYEKVTVNIESGTQTYAKVGDRLYSKHAVDRMQPSGNRFGHPITQAGGDYGRSVSPEYVEEVLRTAQPILQENGNLSYVLGSVEVITNKMGAVITIITK